MTELTTPPAWRTVDFISDLHLHASEPATFTAWQHYLQSTPADAVFILGDLFEVWVGDDAVSDTVGDHLASTAASFEDQCAQVLGEAATRLPLFFMLPRGSRKNVAINVLAVLAFIAALYLAMDKPSTI